MMFKPMLATAVPLENMEKHLRFPMYVSPKLDGVRGIIIDGELRTRSGKPFGNVQLQQKWSKRNLPQLDGEFIHGDPTAHNVFNLTGRITSTILALPDVKFHVFDVVDQGSYERRWAMQPRPEMEGLHVVSQNLVHNMDELLICEKDYLSAGYEGAMLRAPESGYKFGRSTLREGWLLKLKRTVDSEAVILGMDEQEQNNNEGIRNRQGALERSSHKANRIGKNTMGSLRVRDVVSGVEFNIGTGFDDNERQQFWNRSMYYIGKIVKYRFQPVGVKDKPRFPSYLGLRDPTDME